MLNPFPQLLVFGIFAPTLLRVVIAIIFAYVGLHTWRRAAHLAHVRLPIVGAQAWVPYVAGLAELALAAMFLVGWYTQIAALLGIAGMIKYAMYRRWWPQAGAEYLPFSSGVAILVSIICLSLLLSGAGQPAFDVYL